MNAFINLLKNDPNALFDYIGNHGHEFTKTELIYVVRELLYGISEVKETMTFPEDLDRIFEIAAENLEESI